MDAYHKINTRTKAAKAADSTSAASDAQNDKAADFSSGEKKRTTGLWLFDIGLYPILSNFSVWAISVAFTFLTDRGSDLIRTTGKNGIAEYKPAYGNVGKWFAARGVWLEKQFKHHFNMSDKSAQMSRIVFFSFADGTLLAPLVKVLEDRREKIAMWIDERLGTKPKDSSVYEAEPKQSWSSIILGRAATAAVVVPVAMALNKNIFLRTESSAIPAEETTNFKLGSTEYKANTSLNDVLFNFPSIRDGEALMAKPGIRQRFFSLVEKITGFSAESKVLRRDPHGSIAIETNHTLNAKDSQGVWGNENAVTPISSQHYSADHHGMLAAKTLAKMTYFEAFYTSVCTAGLYISSRFLATLFGKSSKNQKKDAPQIASDSAQPAANDENYHQDISPKHHEKQTPSSKIGAVYAESERLIASEPSLAAGA